MTREDAIKMLKSKMDGHTDTSYEWAETIRMTIKALEQESVLDKIRAEIESCREDEIPHSCDYRYHRNEGLDMALDIIDKYKESEIEE